MKYVVCSCKLLAVFIFGSPLPLYSTKWPSAVVVVGCPAHSTKKVHAKPLWTVNQGLNVVFWT